MSVGEEELGVRFCMGSHALHAALLSLSMVGREASPCPAANVCGYFSFMTQSFPQCSQKYGKEMGNEISRLEAVLINIYKNKIGFPKNKRAIETFNLNIHNKLIRADLWQEIFHAAKARRKWNNFCLTLGLLQPVSFLLTQASGRCDKPPHDKSQECCVFPSDFMQLVESWADQPSWPMIYCNCSVKGCSKPSIICCFAAAFIYFF